MARLGPNAALDVKGCVGSWYRETLELSHIKTTSKGGSANPAALRVVLIPAILPARCLAFPMIA